MKIRVREENTSGNSLFFPQYRRFLKWRFFTETNTYGSKVRISFNTVENAASYACKFQKTKVTIHKVQ